MNESLIPRADVAPVDGLSHVSGPADAPLSTAAISDLLADTSSLGAVR